LRRCYLAAGLIVLLVLKQLLWIDFVEIRMAGKELSLDPVLMFLWHAYWGWAWGVLGFILDYPMLAAVRIVLRPIRGYETWTTLLSDE
jgi:predicted PurR-regulated permease PerM